MSFHKEAHKSKVLHLDWGNPQCQYRLEVEYHKEESKINSEDINSSNLLCNFSCTYRLPPRLFVQWKKGPGDVYK